MRGVFGIGFEPFGVVMRGHEDHVDRHGAGREEVIGHFKGLEGRNLPYEGFETLLDELGVFGGGAINYIGDGRRVVGKFGDGSATLSVTNQQGSISFFRR